VVEFRESALLDIAHSAASAGPGRRLKRPVSGDSVV
jgi:hypothetical protein